MSLALLRSAFPTSLRRQIGNAREMARRQAASRPCSFMPTAVSALDDLLQGGLPRGELVELIGKRSSGRFSTVLSTLAAATSSGEAAALVDLGDAFDPQSAAEAGLSLERLLWVRPQHLKQGLIATEMLLHGGLPLVILELGVPPVPGGRGAEASWMRLERAAQRRGAALLVASPYRVSGTAAAAVVETRGSRQAWTGRGRSPRLLAGLSCRLELKKRRGSSLWPSSSARTGTEHEPLARRAESP